MSTSFFDLILKNINTELVKKTLREPISVEIQGHEEHRMGQLFVRLFHKGLCAVTFLNGGKCFQSIVESTTRRPTSIWTTNSPSTLDSLISLRSIPLINIRFVTKQLRCSLIYGRKAQIAYTVQKVANTWIIVADSAGMRLFFRLVSSYVMFDLTGNVFEVLSEKCVRYGLRSQAIIPAKLPGPVTEKKEAAPEV